MAGAVDKDYFQYLQQVANMCTLKPMNLKTLNDFSDLAAMILKGQTYDAVAAAATIPQALATIQQLFAASISAVASISDIHAQLGDLNDPDSWDISGNPTDFCPASTPQPAKH